MASAERGRWIIERLGRGHVRAAFACGNAALDDWLKRQASQYEKRDLARVYVAVRQESPAVLGYYAISSHRVRPEDLPEVQVRGLPRIDVPVVLLGRLAVDRSTQGQGLGSTLLLDALRRAQHLAEQVGIRGVEVDAIDDAAVAFYRKFGFVPLRDDPRHLMLPMQVIRELGLPPL